MEEEKGPVKHMLLAKFRDEITTEKVEELIRGYANLVPLIDPMKAFHWRLRVRRSPAHVEFANIFLPALEKVIVIDYKPNSSKL
ncbi:unnamed protein product [Spirodela intermedia]|uniref:Stress-response A/B barrel domain-containing protein n=1 Tax=Spirodela intermedia TaxID=51605 RepID=A0A7I8JGQ2_SPIIN|nr:unnamed protein product [Spirodela intermedia]CAA6669306.1 unnamed protein product [Spirodela intermedia]